MRVKLTRAGEGGGARPPFSLHLPSPVKLQCTLQLSGQIHWPCSISSKNMFSVVWTNRRCRIQSFSISVCCCYRNPLHVYGECDHLYGRVAATWGPHGPPRPRRTAPPPGPVRLPHPGGPVRRGAGGPVQLAAESAGALRGARVRGAGGGLAMPARPLSYSRR